MIDGGGTMASRPGPLRERVYEELKVRLVTGAHPAGDRLSVVELSREFGVSKQPVMDALRLLSADGLVAILPQSGCRVAAYDLADAERFFRMFAAAETAVVEAATTGAEDAELAELASWVASLVSQVDDTGSPVERSRRYWRQNREMHHRIHALARSPLLSIASQRMWDLSDFLIATLGGPATFGEGEADRHGEHDTIVAAMRARDATGAGELMKQHILHNADLVLATEPAVAPR